jgi:hypothetical protein
MNNEKYIGLDVHQATVVVAVRDSTGKLVMESIVETEAATLLQFFAGLRGTLRTISSKRGIGYRGEKGTSQALRPANLSLQRG